MSRYTEHQLFQLINKRYAGDAYAVLASVRSKTGSDGKIRTADAVVMSLWPSRGLWAAGFEIKSQLSDLRRELKDPAKAEEIARFMRYWWLVLADRRWLDKLELPIPETWGILCPDDKGEKLVVSREALALKPQAWTIPFVCSLVREAARQVTEEVMIARRVDEARSEGYGKGYKDGEERQKSRASYHVQELERLAETVKEFKAHSGIDDLPSWDASRIGDAVAAVQRLIGHSHGSKDKRPQAIQDLETMGGALLRLASEVDHLVFNGEAPKDQSKLIDGD